MSNIKQTLFELGQELVVEFCNRNGLVVPKLKGKPPNARNSYQATGLYDPRNNGTIYVDVKACATLGKSGASWSWPGYVIDRTPYGVHAHELGHHVDSLLAASPYQATLGWTGYLSKHTRLKSQEPQLTSYAPNDAEWFAEMFRLFCTNSDLLRLVRPKTYKALMRWFTPVVWESYRVVLKEAPERTKQQADKKIREAQR